MSNGFLSIDGTPVLPKAFPSQAPPPFTSTTTSRHRNRYNLQWDEEQLTEQLKEYKRKCSDYASRVDDRVSTAVSFLSRPENVEFVRNLHAQRMEEYERKAAQYERVVAEEAEEEAKLLSRPKAVLSESDIAFVTALERFNYWKSIADSAEDVASRVKLRAPDSRTPEDNALLLLLQDLEHQSAVHLPVKEAEKRLEDAITGGQWSGFSHSLSEAASLNRSAYVSTSLSSSTRMSSERSSPMLPSSAPPPLPLTTYISSNAAPAVPAARVTQTSSIPTSVAPAPASASAPAPAPAPSANATHSSATQLFETPRADPRLMKLLYGSPPSQPALGSARARRAATSLASNGASEYSLSPRATARSQNGHAFNTAHNLHTSFQAPADTATPRDTNQPSGAMPMASPRLATSRSLHSAVSTREPAVSMRTNSVSNLTPRSVNTSSRWDGVAAYESPSHDPPTASDGDELSSLLTTMNRQFDMWQQQLQQVASDVQVDLNSLGTFRGLP